MVKNSPLILTLFCTTLAWSSPSRTMEVDTGCPQDPSSTQGKRPFADADNVDDLLGILDAFAKEDRRTERQINEIYDNEDRILQQVLAESEITAKEEESRREAAKRQQARGNQNVVAPPQPAAGEEEGWVFVPEQEEAQREEAGRQQAQANQNVVTPPQPAPGEEEEWVFVPKQEEAQREEAGRQQAQGNQNIVAPPQPAPGEEPAAEKELSERVLVDAGEFFRELKNSKGGRNPSREEMMASMQTKMGVLPEKAEAILGELGLYEKPQEAIEDEIIQALAASMITANQEESQRERRRRAERKEEKRSLAETIRDLHPQVIALREEAKEIESQASKALKTYIDLISSNPEIKGSALDTWHTLLAKKSLAYSNLDQATARENTILDQYFALVLDQDSLKPKDKASRETPEKEEKRLLANSLRILRLQVAALRKEVRETNAEASVARTRYRELMNSDSKEEESAKKTSDDLQALKITLESELDIAIAKESIMISDYFKLGEKPPTADLSKNKAA